MSEMTDSVADQPGDAKARVARGKRERLTEGAREVLHKQGVERTTLADIAGAADVPVGNVYYYFKTKDELVEAAIEAHAEEITARLAALDKHRTPKARLKAFVRMLGEQGELTARYARLRRSHEMRRNLSVAPPHALALSLNDLGAALAVPLRRPQG